MIESDVFLYFACSTEPVADELSFGTRVDS
jgi:hypothetical protein